MAPYNMNEVSPCIDGPMSTRRMPLPLRQTPSKPGSGARPGELPGTRRRPGALEAGGCPLGGEEGPRMATGKGSCSLKRRKRVFRRGTEEDLCSSFACIRHLWCKKCCHAMLHVFVKLTKTRVKLCSSLYVSVQEKKMLLNCHENSKKRGWPLETIGTNDLINGRFPSGTN